MKYHSINATIIIGYDIDHQQILDVYIIGKLDVNWLLKTYDKIQMDHYIGCWLLKTYIIYTINRNGLYYAQHINIDVLFLQHSQLLLYSRSLRRSAFDGATVLTFVNKLILPCDFFEKKKKKKKNIFYWKENDILP